MTREELTQILDDAEAENGSSNFVVEINPSDMRSVLARLRHMKVKGIVSDYDKVDFKRVEVWGYGS